MQRTLQDLQSRVSLGENGLSTSLQQTENQLTLIDQRIDQSVDSLSQVESQLQDLLQEYAATVTGLQDFASQLALLRTQVTSLQSRVQQEEYVSTQISQTVTDNFAITNGYVTALSQKDLFLQQDINLVRQEILDVEQEVIALEDQLAGLNSEITLLQLEAQYLASQQASLFELDDFRAKQIAWILLRDVLNNFIFPITRRVTLDGFKNIRTTDLLVLPTLSQSLGASLMSVLVPSIYAKLTGNFLDASQSSLHYAETPTFRPSMFRLYSGTYTVTATLELEIQPWLIQTAYANFVLANFSSSNLVEFSQSFGLMSFELIGWTATTIREPLQSPYVRLGYATQYLPSEYRLEETQIAQRTHRIAITLTSTFEIPTSSTGAQQSALFAFQASCGNGINYGTYAGSTLSPQAGKTPLFLTYTIDKKSSPNSLYKGYIQPGGTTNDPLFANAHLNGLYQTYLV